MWCTTFKPLVVRPEALVIDGLVVERGGRVLLAIDRLVVHHGSLLLVLGPNGSGKTTLIRAILGLIRHRGRVCVYGVCGPGRRRLIGYVPQRIAVGDVPMTVLEYVAYPLRFLGIANAEERAMRALELVGLGGFAGEDVRRLSAGMLQRAAIARAVAGGPRLLLLDELFGNLDDESARAVARLIDGLRGGTTIVVTSHVRLELLRPDQVLRLGHGAS